jgi:putative ABC transport system ATP-binding protein
MLKLENVSKVYAMADHVVEVLKGVSLEVATGSSLAIVGPSGSGKTTLLGLCAGLDIPSAGRVLLNGTDLGALDEEGRAALRCRDVGFVFQNFQLLPTLNALENIAVPLELRRDRLARRKALEWLDRVGLSDRADHYPVQLSGGEQQRVALARAMVGEPAVLFADEPTGNLDGDTSDHIEELLFASHRSSSSTLVLVTHDSELAAKADAVLRLRGGRAVDG